MRIKARNVMERLDVPIATPETAGAVIRKIERPWGEGTRWCPGDRAPSRVPWALAIAACLLLTGLAPCAASPTDELIKQEITEHAIKNTWTVHAPGRDLYQIFSGPSIDVMDIQILGRLFRQDEGVVKFALHGVTSGVGDIKNSYGFSENAATPYISDSFYFEGEWLFRKYEEGWKVSETPSMRLAQYQKTPNAALFDAVERGDLVAVERLIEAGTAVDAPIDREGYTALFFATASGNRDLVRLLLQYGADSTTEWFLSDEAQAPASVLEIAAAYGHLEVVRMLHGNGAGPATDGASAEQALMLATKHGHLDVVEELLSKAINVDVKGEDGRTPLLIAVENNDPEMVERLLAAGADIDTRDGSGHTAFALALEHGCAGDVLRLVAARVSNGGGVSEVGTGATALMLSAQHGCLESVERLLRAGVDVNAKRQSGGTALMDASSNGHLNVVELLVAVGAEVGAARHDSATALSLAGDNGYDAIVRFLAMRQDANGVGAISEGELLYMDNCARCHGRGGVGTPGYPVLADDDWLHGGTRDVIELGVRNGRKGAMSAHKELLSEEEVDVLARWVVAMSQGGGDEAGWTLYASKGCSACHGGTANGILAVLPDGPLTVGAANLTDDIWRFPPSGFESAKYTILYGVNQAGVDGTRESICPDDFGQFVSPSRTTEKRDREVALVADYVYGLRFRTGPQPDNY